MSTLCSYSWLPKDLQICFAGGCFPIFYWFVVFHRPSLRLRLQVTSSLLYSAWDKQSIKLTVVHVQPTNQLLLPRKSKKEGFELGLTLKLHGPKVKTSVFWFWILYNFSYHWLTVQKDLKFFVILCFRFISLIFLVSIKSGLWGFYISRYFQDEKDSWISLTISGD